MPVLYDQCQDAMMPSSANPLLSAALRHVRDAKNLLSGSPDQAWHLAGFGPECARKACLHVSPWSHRLLGHELGSGADEILEWVMDLDPQAHRHSLDPWASSPILMSWKPDHRYEATGTCRRQGRDVNDLVATAAEVVDRLHWEMWADGLLDVPEE